MQNKTVLFNKFGTAAELYVKEISLPQITDNEMLIKTSAAALNPIDAKIRNGSSFVCKNRKEPFPWTLGFDFAGTVKECGCNLDFHNGDKIAGIVGHSFNPRAYAQYIVSDDKLIVKVPDNVSLKEAAALPTAGVTALDILNTLKEKKDKGNVLVLGGSGGVGHLLIQLLQIHGYNVTAGASIKNFAFLKELGTNEIFDYHDDYKTKYKDQFDAAIDFIGDDIGIGLYEVLKENGLLVTVPSYSFNKVISACPSCKQVKSVLAAPSREKIAYLLKLCSSGKLKVHITKEFKLNTEGAQLAHLQIESTHTRGKIILVP
ncbi:NADP-dependent oxidoreductase [Succinatimonas hippei]|uniref:NADP-dependent oxidoreductase n=1 Tax=Succinatimonas hippei TaxID=626938 RepID=UPI0020132D04|nr:NADP-dependent oxidoreductase [Succinatimonas hippei]MCL1602348.1 NADP-dependent oxidoreductase [Succinatimonas hippei]